MVEIFLFGQVLITDNCGPRPQGRPSQGGVANRHFLNLGIAKIGFCGSSITLGLPLYTISNPPKIAMARFRKRQLQQDLPNIEDVILKVRKKRFLDNLNLASLFQVGCCLSSYPNV